MEEIEIEMDPEASAEDAEPLVPPTNTRRRLLLALVLILIPTLAGAGFAYIQYPAVVRAASTLGFRPDSGAAIQPVEYGEFFELERMIINPAESKGQRYLMVDLSLESPSADALAELKKKKLVVRDTILKVLGRHTTQELANIDFRVQLKEELRLAINAILQSGDIRRIYFSQYVLQ